MDLYHTPEEITIIIPIFTCHHRIILWILKEKRISLECCPWIPRTISYISKTIDVPIRARVPEHDKLGRHQPSHGVEWDCLGRGQGSGAVAPGSGAEWFGRTWSRNAAQTRNKPTANLLSRRDRRGGGWLRLVLIRCDGGSSENAINAAIEQYQPSPAQPCPCMTPHIAGASWGRSEMKPTKCLPCIN